MEEIKIPNDLEEAIQLLFEGNQDYLDKIKSMSEDEFTTTFHHSTGRNLRNIWGLWNNDTPIGKWFENIGVMHGDDRSGIIMDSFHRRLLGKELDLDGQIDYYKQHWESQGIKDMIIKK